MRANAFHPRKGYTIVEMCIAMPAALICFSVVFYLIWTGTTLVTRNLSVNLSHLNVARPIQRLTDDIHMTLAMPQLTGPLAAGAQGSVPAGYAGGGTGSTQSKTGGKMTAISLPIVTGSGPAEGICLYRAVSTQYSNANAALTLSGSYNAAVATFPVAYGTSGSYPASGSTISVELKSDAESTLFLSATNGMHLCIPSATVLVGGNSTMLDQKIKNVTITGNAASTTLVANCTLSGTLGASITTNGTRSTANTAQVLAYLVAPVNYFVCGTDLIRLDYNGTWQAIMHNVVPTATGLTQAKPFSLPYPYVNSFLSATPDGTRVVNVSFASTNPDYSNNLIYRGGGSNMLMYNLLIWSRMQKYKSGTDFREELTR